MLKSETDKLNFVFAFRDLTRIHNVIITFSQCTWNDLIIDEQTYLDYRSKYLDIHEHLKGQGEGDDEKASILEDVDFELELLGHDTINYDYIMDLLKAMLKDRTEGNEDSYQARKKMAINLIKSEPRLRSKRGLIEEFIESYLGKLTPTDTVEDIFGDFLNAERQKDISRIMKEHDITETALRKLMEETAFSNKLPTDNRIVKALNTTPSILSRKRIAGKIKNFLEEIQDKYA